MKTLATIMAVMLPVVAHGSIGETKVQCDKRYGDPIEKIKHDPMSGYLTLRYEKSDVQIEVIIWKRMCHSIQYWPIPASQFELLMNANGKDWAYKHKKTWMNKECIAIDSPRKDDKSKRSHLSLIIKTKAMEKHNQDLKEREKEREKEKQKEQDAKALKGF